MSTNHSREDRPHQDTPPRKKPARRAPDPVARALARYDREAKDRLQRLLGLDELREEMQRLEGERAFWLRYRDDGLFKDLLPPPPYFDRLDWKIRKARAKIARLEGATRGSGLEEVLAMLREASRSASETGSPLLGALRKQLTEATARQEEETKLREVGKKQRRFCFLQKQTRAVEARLRKRGPSETLERVLQKWEAERQELALSLAQAFTDEAADAARQEGGA